MYLEVLAGDPGVVVRLREPADFASLAVRVPVRFTEGALLDLLVTTAWGRPAEDGRVALSVQKLRSEVVAAEPDAGQKFDRMIDYARDHGWLHANGSMVTAHIEKS